jgi:serine/threonine-protein kinase HipA
MEKLFTLIVLNCTLRNGDAHLKNFGVVYEDVLGEARLAPAFDLVTTTVYLPQDQMALTLNGTARWPSGRELQRVGETRLGSSPRRVREVFQRVGDALAETAKELRAYADEHGAFREIAGGMLEQWALGRQSFGA